jgi:hypothetical protein
LYRQQQNSTHTASLSLKGCAPLTPSAVPSLTRQRARGVKTSVQTLSCLSWPNINTSGVDFDEKRALVLYAHSEMYGRLSKPSSLSSQIMYVWSNRAFLLHINPRKARFWAGSDDF